MFKKSKIKTANIEPKKEFTKTLKLVKLKKFLLIILVVLVVVSTYNAWYFYKKYQEIKSNPNLVAQKEAEMLISALGKLMELPQDETPTIATISDKEKLKNQPFFKMAENGDKLFAYNTVMMAILYRPSTNKIINVAPISINQPQNSTENIKEDAPIPVP